jgi:hypothetical protein
LRYRIFVKRDSARDEGLKELGANARLKKIAFNGRGQKRSYPERCRLMKEYKLELKTEYRKIALECHPDRNMDASEDVRQTREAYFKRVSRAVDFLMTVEPAKPRAPRMRRPMPMNQGFVMVVNMGQQNLGLNDLRFGTGGKSASTTATGGGFTDPNFWPWHG